jgi:acetyltransferase
MLLEYFSQVDPETSNIAFYLEGFKEGRARQFLQLAKNSEDTVIVFFGGKTREGKVATQSHTASLAGDFKIIYNALRQHFIIQPSNERELLTSLKVYDVLSQRRNPFGENVITQGDVAIVSVSGGHAVIASDMLKEYGLNAIRFSHQEKRELKELMNPVAREIASFNNPIDLTGSVLDTDIEDIMRYLSDIENIECIILLLLPYPPNISFQIGRRIANIITNKNKPVVCFVPYVPKYSMIIESLELANIPVFHSIRETIQAVAALKERNRMDNLKLRNVFGNEK